MIAVAITLFFVVLAVFFNSIMDATENEPNFNESIFKNLNKKFWLKTVSWQFARKIFGWKFDAWHVAKSGMVLSIAGAIIAAIFVGVYLAANPSLLFISASLATIGAAWNGSFKLFYHIIFKVK